MNRLLLVAAFFALLFVAATLVRTAPWQADAPKDDEGQAAAEKERIRRFWSLHREAGRRRTAGAFDEAIRLYEAALKLDGQHEDALYYVSNVYLDVGRLHDAERTLEHLVRFHPTSARGHSRLGDVHLCYADTALFDTHRARDAYQNALALNKEETGPLLRLAQVALVDGHLDEAQRLFDAVAATHVQSLDAHYFGGYVAWEQGRIRTAGTLYERAVQLAQGAVPKERVIGEGDRKTGTAITSGELLTCPTMDGLVQDVAASRTSDETLPSMPDAYRKLGQALARLRTPVHAWEGL